METTSELIANMLRKFFIRVFFFASLLRQAEDGKATEEQRLIFLMNNLKYTNEYLYKCAKGKSQRGEFQLFTIYAFSLPYKQT